MDWMKRNMELYIFQKILNKEMEKQTQITKRHSDNAVPVHVLDVLEINY